MTTRYSHTLFVASALAALLLLAGCEKPKPIEFFFEPLGADGNTYTGSGSFATDPWPCISDLRTGLMWEVKSQEPGLHHAANTYTWYFTTGEIYTRGDNGVQNGGTCVESDCDTEGFVEAVNARGLCGHHDWRIPTKEELGSLIDPRIRTPGPTLDTTYFPTTGATEYWTSSTYVYHAPSAWAWGFDHGLDRVDHKAALKHIKLVRGEVEIKLEPARPHTR